MKVRKHPVSKRYPELHKLPWSPNWVFRRYSKERGEEFVQSTGILATEKNAAQAYKKGLEGFDKWLGALLPQGKRLLVKDIAHAILVAKEAKRDNTYKSTRNQMQNHVIPAFGHFRPDQITPLKWKIYDETERKAQRKDRNGRVRKRTKLYNTRKALIEILIRAKDEGLIREVPKLKNFDGPAAPPKFISKKDYLAIRRKLSFKIKLLAFVMYEQGPRPTEALRYRWEMIDWTQGDAGSISIPGEITKTGRPRTIPLNSKVSRFLRWYQVNASEGSCIFPSRNDPNKALGGYNAVWDRAVQKLGLDYTAYNLRDTFITNKLKGGFSSVFIGKYTDTSATMIEKKYAVAEGEAMRGIAG